MGVRDVHLARRTPITRIWRTFGRLRRQADRLQGARPAARRLAPGPGEQHPEARLQVAGFGEYEGALRRLLDALERGDLDDAREVARLGRALEGGEEKPLPILSAFLAEPPPGYAEAARAAAGSVEFIGRLEHDEVAELLPRAEALVMPSTFPEAFGMVAVEAAACGALPVSAGHSGMLEVSRQLAAELPPEVARADSPSRSSPARSRRSRLV